jgi:glucan phosphoethanolaminetransferase (alkaline phosphatase superfamily)
MNYYYYLLFRLHTHLSKNNVYDSKGVNFLTTLVSSLYIIFFWFNISCFLDVYFPTNPYVNYILTENQLVIIFVLIGFLNYIFFVRGKKFLKLNFKEDKKEGYLIFIVFILMFIVFLILGQKNRDRIVQENERIRTERLK